MRPNQNLFYSDIMKTEIVMNVRLVPATLFLTLRWKESKYLSPVGKRHSPMMLHHSHTTA